MMAMSALQAFSFKPRLNAPTAQVAVCKLKLDFHVNIQFSYRKNFSSCSYCIQENLPVRSPLWSHDKVNRLTINCALASNTGLESKTSLVINDRKITVESHEDGKIHIRVDIPGEETQKTFDNILTGLTSEAGPIKGFRRQKGGKTANVPDLVLLKILGRSRVRNSVIKELISTTVEDYVNEEELKVKKDLDIKESTEELDMAFEPGKDFSFSAVIELEEEELEKE